VTKTTVLPTPLLWTVLEWELYGLGMDPVRCFLVIALLQLGLGLQPRRFFPTTIAEQQLLEKSSFSNLFARGLYTYETDQANPKQLFQQSETVIVVPLADLTQGDQIKLQEVLETIKKQYDQKRMPKPELVYAVDGTPFVQIVPDIQEGSSIVIFSKSRDLVSESEKLVAWIENVKCGGVVVAQREKAFRLGRYESML